MTYVRFRVNRELVPDLPLFAGAELARLQSQHRAYRAACRGLPTLQDVANKIRAWVEVGEFLFGLHEVDYQHVQLEVDEIIILNFVVFVSEKVREVDCVLMDYHDLSCPCSFDNEPTTTS